MKKKRDGHIVCFKICIDIFNIGKSFRITATYGRY